MTIASEITRIKTNIENAYAKAEEKGGTMPELRNSDGLSSCIESITVESGGSSSAGRFDVIDGVANVVSGNLNGRFNGITKIGENSFYCTFENLTNLTGEVAFPDLTTIENEGMEKTFQGCTGLTTINLSSLTDVGSYGLYNTFKQCNNVTTLNLDSLKTVGSYGFYYAFDYCNKLAELNFKSLITLNVSAFMYSFRNCTSLTAVSFPMLTNVAGDSLNNAFSNCTNLTEIHFRADMQSTIEGMSQYSNKFGATNATIYFDL